MQRFLYTAFLGMLPGLTIDHTYVAVKNDSEECMNIVNIIDNDKHNLGVVLTDRCQTQVLDSIIIITMFLVMNISINIVFLFVHCSGSVQ